MTAPLCFLDTETDGVHPSRKAWEVALVRREPNGEEKTEHIFLPIDLATADPFGLQVGRFYDRHPLGRRLSGQTGAKPAARTTPLSTAAAAIARMTHAAHIVGAVPNFDTETLAQLLRAEGFTPAWYYHLCDVENLAVGWLAGRGQPLAPPWSSDALTAALGVPPIPERDRHTALGDARWAMRLYDAVISARTAEEAT